MSRLVLGTAQFGSAYGLANRERRVGRDAIAAILDLAWKSGVRVLDTAPAYGDAEKTIGELASGRFAVISKTPSNAEPEKLVSAVAQSLRDLRVDRLEALLVHHAPDLLGPGGDALFRALEALRAENAIGKIGVSVYDPQTLSSVLGRYPLEIVQLPINLLDQRFVAMLPELRGRGIEVHARSVFLQGALAMQHLPDRFKPVMPKLEKLRGDGGAAAALAFVRDLKIGIVIGVDSAAQLSHLLEAFKSAKAPQDAGAYATDDPQVIDPRTWTA